MVRSIPFFDVFFDIRKGGLSGPIALFDNLVLSSSGVPWSHFPPPDAIETTDVNRFLNGTNRDADFWAMGPFQESHPSGATLVVTAAAVPEPGSFSLLAIGALACLARRIFSGGFARSSSLLRGPYGPPNRPGPANNTRDDTYTAFFIIIRARRPTGNP